MSDFVTMSPNEHMIHPLKSSNGFSLVELIASLVLAGILAVALTTIIVTAIDGFFLSKDAAEISQKAQLTMARIRVELVNATGISFAGQDKIAFTNEHGSYEIERSSTLITVAKTGPDSIPAQTLTSGIQTDYYTGNKFLSYEKAGGTSWSASDNLSELNAIVINLKFTDYNNAFQTTITPRMNGLRNAPKLVINAPNDNAIQKLDTGPSPT